MNDDKNEQVIQWMVTEKNTITYLFHFLDKELCKYCMYYNGKELKIKSFLNHKCERNNRLNTFETRLFLTEENGYCEKFKRMNT